jgi:hypothetical protein
MAFVVDGDLKELLESGVAVSVATADGAGRPHVAMAWAPQVGGGGRQLAVYIEEPRAGQVLADLAETGRMAVTVGSPISYRSVQLKGRLLGWRPAGPGDQGWILAHREAFMTATMLVGDPLPAIRNLYMAEAPMLRFEIAVEQAFDQTPGPEAGRPL